MKDPPTETIIATHVYPQHQSWYFQRTINVEGHRLRVEIRRNAYDDQSFAKVDKWDGVKWHNVVEWPITACECQKISYVERGIGPEAFENDYRKLLNEALEIIL